MSELILAEDLVHLFPDGGIGLDGASLVVNDGDFLVLAGRNGSGKSLLARHFVGLAKPSAGKVLFRGIPVQSNPLAARRAIGYVFQESDSQIVGQTLLEDVEFGPANLGLPRHEV